MLLVTLRVVWVVYFHQAVKKLWIFGTFLVGGGDITHWLEITCFWFVMTLCITIYVGGWEGNYS